MSEVRAAVLDALRALGAGFWTPRQVHHAMGCWSAISVRQQLRQLTDDGVTERQGLVGAYAYRLREGG